MEINITRFFNEANPRNYSASQMELGEDAGRITWNNAKQCSINFVNDETREAIQDHFRSFGAWTEEEIAAWTDNELNAILIQDISAEMREFELAEDWADYEQLSQAGTLSGRLFETGGQIYFYIGE